MRPSRRWARTILPGALALSVLAGPAAAQQPSTGGQKKQAAQEAADVWPKKIPFAEATVVCEAPRADTFDGMKVAARGAARFEGGDKAAPIYGTVWYESPVAVDSGQRTVRLTSVTVPRVEFEGMPPARQERMATRLTQAMSRVKPVLSLDDVLADSRLARRRDEKPPKLNTEPPKILIETEPAILVMFDGDPRFEAVPGTKLERAQNTPFLVLRDPASNQYYLNGGTMWFSAPNPSGPWSKTDQAPREATQIAARDLKDGGVSQDEVEKARQTADKRVPKIITATEPTELIVSEGAPQWTPVVAGELDMIANSEGDLFRTTSDRQYWVVLSGRWYRSGSLSGPWAYVEPSRLPASFSKIPSDSPKANVLVFVAGTRPAREAVADATKPRTTAVQRSQAHATVTYDGDPKFEQVSGTRVEYAVNTPDQVLKIRGRYYVCDQGMWFTSGAPTGPWAVADAIPEDEIQTIPPESPVYNTRYAYVYDATPDLVYMAYTPAYLGSYPYYGGVVFGTGWYYRPWWGAHYYPRPWTWGFHAMWAPAIGWGFGFGWGPAWGGFRYGFGWGWGARWCGPGGFFRPAWRNVNVTRNVSANRNVTVNRNLYNSGANKNRTATTQSANAKSTASGAKGANKQGANAGKQGSGTKGGNAGKQGSGASGGKKGASSGAKAKPQGHAGGHGGGGKKH